MDLFEDDKPGENAHDFTVSELSGAIKRVLEGEFGRVRVKAEVGRVVVSRPGHLYYDLKDEKAVISAVSFKGQAARLTVQPEEGMEVVATGQMTTYARGSRYQLIVDDVRPAGVGALMAMLEKRKKALEAEGLFDGSRKKPIPYLPEIIGVVTSPTGAVIRDILHRLRDRFPRKVLLWPVAVQGDRSAKEVARAIEGFNALTPGGALPRPDLLIVARGGGSIEDLWSFNEEIVVRAAAASEIPLISAVGHETDTTLIDHAADRRAPTPTAAAEMAVPVRLDLLGWVEAQDARLLRGVEQGVTRRKERLRDVARALPRPETLLTTPRQRLDAAERALPAALMQGTSRHRDRFARASGGLRPSVLRGRVSVEREALARLAARLTPAMERVIEKRSERLATTDRLRESLGYQATLGRGYALVRADGALAPDKATAASASHIEIEFRDGRLSLGAAPAKPSSKKPKPKGSDQGSLF